MKQRKKELQQITALLEREHEDVDALALEVWNLVDSLRRGRELWVVGVNYQGIGQFLYGPYESIAMAEKDMGGKGNIRAMSAGDTGRVFRLSSPSIAMGLESATLFDSR